MAKSSNFVAKNARLVKEALANRTKEEKAMQTAALIEAKKLSNQPTFTVDTCIHDILSSTRDIENAGSRLVIAVFNDIEHWSLATLTSYFAAPPSQSVTQLDGTSKLDKSIKTRPMILAAFLSTNEEYKLAVDAINAMKSEYKTVKKAKPHDAVREAELDAMIADALKPIKAVEQKLHRAFIAAYQCRVAGYVSVTIGTANRLMVTAADGKQKQFTETSIRDAGTVELKKLGHIKTKKRQTKAPEPVKALSAVDANTALPVLDSLAKLVEANGLPVTSEDKLSLERIAVFALESVNKVNESKATFSEELRGTLSDIAVAVFAALKVKSLKEVTDISKKAGRPA